MYYLSQTILEDELVDRLEMDSMHVRPLIEDLLFELDADGFPGSEF